MAAGSRTPTAPHRPGRVHLALLPHTPQASGQIQVYIVVKLHVQHVPLRVKFERVPILKLVAFVPVGRRAIPDPCASARHKTKGALSRHDTGFGAVPTPQAHAGALAVVETGTRPRNNGSAVAVALRSVRTNVEESRGVARSRDGKDAKLLCPWPALLRTLAALLRRAWIRGRRTPCQLSTVQYGRERRCTLPALRGRQPACAERKHGAKPGQETGRTWC